MGDHADDMAARAQCYEGFIERMELVALKNKKNYNNGALYWTTKDSGKILVQEMEDSHVRNTLNMLQRKYDGVINDEVGSWIEIFGAELDRRKEKAIKILKDADVDLSDTPKDAKASKITLNFTEFDLQEMLDSEGGVVFSWCPVDNNGNTVEVLICRDDDA